MEVAREPRILITDHLHVDLLAHVEPDASHKILIDPGLQFAHPSSLDALATDI